MRALLASLFVIVLVVAAVARGGDDQADGASHSSDHRSARPHRHHVVVRYTAPERMLIDSIDIAAGKAMQAASSPDGLFERRSSQEWCGAAIDAENTLVRRHSLAWAGRVDHASDAESQKFQLATRACG